MTDSDADCKNQKKKPFYYTPQSEISSLQLTIYLLRCFFPVPQEDHTGRTIRITATPGGFPARFALVRKRRAYHAPFVWTVLDLPAGRIVEELLDPFDADLFGVDQFADTAQPFDVVFRIEPVSPLPRREDKTMFLIQTQRLCRRPNQLCSHAHGVERRVLVFEHIQIIDYHMLLSSPKVFVYRGIRIVILSMSSSTPMMIRTAPLTILIALKCFFSLLNDDRNALMATAERIKGTPRPSE